MVSKDPRPLKSELVITYDINADIGSRLSLPLQVTLSPPLSLTPSLLYPLPLGPISPGQNMALSDEAPFTSQELEEILDLVHTVLGPIQQYSTLVNSIAVSPTVFLQLPVYQERLQCLIDSFSVIYDLLPQSVFCQQMDAMLDCRDALSMAEQHAPLVSDPNATPLFGELQWEDGPNGPRLSIPRELVETLMYDVNLTNQEIANILCEFQNNMSGKHYNTYLNSACSLRTLQRRLDEWQLYRRESTLNDEELYGLIYNYKTTVGMFFGERAIFGLLTAQHHWAPRWKIRQIIRQIDPLGVETRCAIYFN